MNSVGSFLKKTREQQGKTVARVASELCITGGYLEAIENDDLAKLPGAFFYRSFVRQYAGLLGVPFEKIQAGLDAIVAPPESAPALVPAPVLRPAYPDKPIYQPDAIVQAYNHILSDRNIGMSAAVLVVVLLACSAFYSWWTRPSDPAATVQAAAAESQPKIKVSVPAAAPAPANAAQLTPVAAEAEALGHADLEISATEQVWLSVTSNGNVIFSGVLEPAQTKTLQGVDGAQMKVGNAGGIELRWKGKPVGPVGPRGQVRTVVLKPDNVEILQPPQEFSEL